MSEKLHISMFGGTGDVVICTPVFKALKEAYPQKKLIVYCWQQKQVAPLLNNPYIHSLRIITKNSHRLFFALFIKKLLKINFISPCFYDAPFVISGQNVDEILPLTIGVKISDPRPQIFLTPAEEQEARTLLEKYKTPVLLHGFAGASINHLWPAGHWEKLVEACPMYDFIQVGLPNEPLIKGAIDFRGKTSIRVMFGLVKYAASFVGLDASLSHISYAFSLNGVVLYGDTSPVQMGHPNNINLYLGLECSPCFYMGTGQVTCPYGHECMEKITVESVKYALDAQVNATRLKRATA